MPSQVQSYSGGKVGLSSRAFQGWLLVLVLLNLLVRLPLCAEPATVTPDGAEYLALARSLREEGRYATDLKWQFFTNDPVRHPAWVDRPPLYPLYAVLCARAVPFLDPTTAARVGNVLLACVALVLGTLYLRRLFGPLPALLAAGYVFLLPHTLYWTTQPLTEALTLVLCLAALLLWDHARETPRGPAHARLLLAAGAACGLAYLTRPTGLLLVFALLLDACLKGSATNREDNDKDREDKDKDNEERDPGCFGVRGPSRSGEDCPSSPVPAGRVNSRLHKAKPASSGSEITTTASNSPGPNPSPHPHRSGDGFTAPRPALRPPYPYPYLHGPYPQALYLIGAFLLIALPYHLLLWHHAGSPFASALGFTYRIRTIHDVTVLGFERAVPSLLHFLQLHGAELPGLLLRQAASHAQGILLPLLGLLPFALGLRRADLSGPRRAPFLVVVLLVVTHTLTWSAKGSSRYFLLCLLLLAGLLLYVGLRGVGRSAGVSPARGSGGVEWGRRLARPGTGHDYEQDHELGAAASPGSGRPSPTPTLIRSRCSRSTFRLPPTAHCPLPTAHCLLLTASALGLAFELTRFYSAQIGSGRGVPEHHAWKAAAAQAQGARLIASDNPWILNLLTERPAVMLPRTTDPEKLERFIREYQPDVLVLFPNEEAERPMAAAWRAGRLPTGWRLIQESDAYLVLHYDGAHPRRRWPAIRMNGSFLKASKKMRGTLDKL